jgi:hypothetical protein
MPAPDSDAFAKAIIEGLSARVDTEPANTTTLHTNTPEGYVSIVLPGEGNLWVYFSPQGGAKAWHWNQVTLFTEIKPNVEQVILYKKGDRLLYQLSAATAATEQIALTWGYE